MRRFSVIAMALAITFVLYATLSLPMMNLYLDRSVLDSRPVVQQASKFPIVPSLNNSSLNEADKAINDVFHYSNVNGWIDVNSLEYEDVHKLRKLGRSIMSRNTSCGRPKVLKEDLASGLEYCFWENDFVSTRAMNNFAFERDLWGWVVREFRKLNLELERYHLNATGCELAFLDAGVNVGDWASPQRVALPTTPIFGIEGSPSTGALAVANMRTSIEHHRRNNNHPVAPTALLPFALVSNQMIENIRESGGICFGRNSANVGSQGVKSAESLNCLPSLTAGATLLPHALQSLISHQPSCRGTQNWPRLYIAKFDIQGFEFKALVSALDWFWERPPCYLMIEMEQVPQNVAITELLLDVGYDSVWRTHNSFANDITFRHEEFPPGPPYWSRSQNTSITLHQAVGEDMKTFNQIWQYKDYIFGFENKEKCLRRLLE
jgi:hypothetical protein